MNVALLGGAPTWSDAPFHDPTWQIWAHASCQPLHPIRVDRWYDLHRVEVWRRGKSWYRPLEDEPETYVDWLAAQTVPVVMQDHYPIVPTSERYPLRAIVEAFGIVPKEWDVTERQWWDLVKHRGELTATGSYMLAQAIYEGVDELALYGMDYAGNDLLHIERTVQKPGVKYWVGIARGLGIPVTIAPGSAFEYQDFLYGYDPTPVLQEA